MADTIIAGSDAPPEGLDQLTEELGNQIRHLERSTCELRSLLDAGANEDGTVLSEDDRAVYADAVVENARALAAKRTHLEELRRLRGGVHL
ncbi:hypothetical protein KFE25_008558 [Diacronema lutheri]|uniref:Uncharacterized protein n=1 Tax=Diacronema lutheri TaxID=2081491 RepID=A0A8J6CCQ9_DIALT|nr:hypothetical protein KFE25_008558 [Diacronema lutheri]|mmetsp:Transcript_9940/g.31379  ORF Transcript_9940/g.31379 Transcript_9940/m.31379 type:complete len:91 (-) Transcript_9940:297-569(-)